MPKVNWRKVKVEVTFELGRLFHRKILAYFDYVSESSTKQQAVDVDNLLMQEKADIYVLHGDFMVYVVTFSSHLCSQIYSMATKATNISVELNDEIIEGIKAVANSDQNAEVRGGCLHCQLWCHCPTTAVKSKHKVKLFKTSQ
jgi:hypothetical protein